MLDFTFLGERTIYFYILLVVLMICIAQGLVFGFLFFLKRSGEKRANHFYGLLLITFALTLLHQVFFVTRFYDHYRSLAFLPIYYTLALPILLFFHVKLNLYPAYRLRWTDLKHFILPIGQFLFFCVVFFSTLEYKSQIDRSFYNPFYGAFEQFLYLLTFFAYLYFSYRYIRQKRRQLRTSKEAKQVWYLQYLIQIFFLLFCIHAAFVVGDFITYELLQVNLQDVKIYAGMGIFSFAALLFWLGIYGFQVLFWGRRVFSGS